MPTYQGSTVVKRRPKDGEQGIQGPLMVQKEWIEGDTHRYTDEVREYFYVRGADAAQSFWYTLTNKGTVIADAPPTGGADVAGYEKVQWLKELSVQFFIAEEANLANFIFKDDKLISLRGTVDGVAADYSGQANFVPNIIIDGKTGKITALDGEFHGTVYATSGELDNVIVRGSSRSPFGYCPDSTSIDYTDNVVMLSDVEHGWLNPYSLPWDLSQSGRRITIVNYKWGETIAVGSNFINAPSGKYFFENGVNKSRLYMRTQAVELLGYGDDTTFYGWIVLNRKNLFNPNFETGLGSPINFIAYGTVYGNNTGATMSAKTFDGHYPSVSRLEKGRYKITLNPSWFSSSFNIIIMATGLGYSYGSSSAPIKATVTERTTTYFVVDTSDDDSRNDGSFMFLIMNYNDWPSIQ